MLYIVVLIIGLIMAAMVVPMQTEEMLHGVALFALAVLFGLYWLMRYSRLLLNLRKSMSRVAAAGSALATTA